MTSKRTRHEIFGLGESLTDDDRSISGCRLPTSLQVLRCVMFHLKEGLTERRTKFEAAKIVYELVVPFYVKGGTPMLAEKTCCQKIVKLLDDNEKFRRFPKARRDSPSILKKLAVEKEKLGKTFPLWTVNAEEEIKNEEERAFLKSMKTDRAASIAGFDTGTDAFYKRKVIILICINFNILFLYINFFCQSSSQN